MKKGFVWLFIIPFLLIIIFIGLVLFKNSFLKKPIAEISKNPKNNRSDQSVASKTTNEAERFVFTRNESSVYSVKTDGTSEIKLNDNGGGKISRDSLQLVFYKDYNLWVVGVDGKGLKQLTTDGKNFTDKFLPVAVNIIDWSPDNTKILYYLRWIEPGLGDHFPPNLKKDPTVKYGIYLFDLAKGAGILITEDLKTEDWQYVGWPKNTDKALFNVGRLNGSEFSEYLYALDINDGSFVKFSNQKYESLWIGGSQAPISGDGKLFVWGCALGDSSYVGETICMSNMDGTQKRVIASGKWGDYQFPRFLLGDRYISLQKVLYTHDRAPSAYEVYLYDILTGKTEKKLEARTFFFLDPDIVVVLKKNDIYKIELTTGKESLLAKDANFDLFLHH